MFPKRLFSCSGEAQTVVEKGARGLGSAPLATAEKRPEEGSLEPKQRSRPVDTEKHHTLRSLLGAPLPIVPSAPLCPFSVHLKRYVASSSPKVEGRAGQGKVGPPEVLLVSPPRAGYGFVRREDFATPNGT